MILERIIHVIRNEKLTRNDYYVHLLNALCWDFSAEDHKMLTRLKVFETLINGNGDRLHPLKKAWGREENHFQVALQLGSTFYLPSRVRQVFEYLAQNVLQGVFVRSKVEKIEIDGSAS